jgi:hypothetical protein
MSKLNSDELGEKGESRFRELCADAKLVCNKSERDRVGWDFTVDFGFVCQDNVSLDKRLPPISCQVQVKTIISSGRSIRVRLNMAERLAKVNKPAFIYVLRVNADKTFADAYLLNISGGRLASILKRLRKETATGTPQDKINKLEITFTIKNDERVDISGESLRLAIEKYCGTDIAEYGEKKQEQIRKLGYEGAPFQMNVSFNPTNQTELEEIFLGIREQVDVSEVETFETRFDIKLPLEKPQPAKITIKPTPSSKCRLTFRAPQFLPASLDADVYFVPAIISLNGQKRIRIKANFVELNVYMLEKGTRFDLQTILPEDYLATINEWGIFYRICQTFHLKGTLEIELVSHRLIILDLAKYPINFPTNYAGLAFLCEKFSEVTRHAGVESHQKFHVEDIVTARDQISLVHDMLSGEISNLSFSEKTVNDESEIQLPSTLFLANSFQVGPLHFGYYIKTKLHIEKTDTRIRINLSDISFRELRLIDKEGNLAAYVERIKQVEDTTNVGHFEMHDSVNTQQTQ